MNRSEKHIGFLFSKPPYYINSEKWNQYHNHVLLLSGLAGSGKTWMSKALCKENNAKLVSLDVLKFYDVADEFSKVVLDEFVSIYPEIADLISKHWATDDIEDTNDKKYTEYTQKFFRYVMGRAKNDDSPYIVEGIQLFARIPWEWSAGLPYIVLRNSALRCFYNVMRRYFKSERELKTVKQKLGECKLHHLRQPGQLEGFIRFMTEKGL